MRNVLFGKSELKGEYGPSFAELELLSEFFIDANAVINKSAFFILLWF